MPHIVQDQVHPSDLAIPLTPPVSPRPDTKCRSKEANRAKAPRPFGQHRRGQAAGRQTPPNWRADANGLIQRVRPIEGRGSNPPISGRQFVQVSGLGSRGIRRGRTGADWGWCVPGWRCGSPTEIHLMWCWEGSGLAVDWQWIQWDGMSGATPADRPLALPCRVPCALGWHALVQRSGLYRVLVFLFCNYSLVGFGRVLLFF